MGQGVLKYTCQVVCLEIGMNYLPLEDMCSYCTKWQYVKVVMKQTKILSDLSVQ